MGSSNMSKILLVVFYVFQANLVKGLVEILSFPKDANCQPFRLSVKYMSHRRVTATIATDHTVVATIYCQLRNFTCQVSKMVLALQQYVYKSLLLSLLDFLL